MAPSPAGWPCQSRAAIADAHPCGTGTVACAILHHLRTGHPAPISVDVKSGDTLEINFTPDGDTFKDVTLTGPAEIVFSGTVQI